MLDKDRNKTIRRMKTLKELRQNPSAKSTFKVEIQGQFIIIKESNGVSYSLDVFEGRHISNIANSDFYTKTFIMNWYKEFYQKDHVEEFTLDHAWEYALKHESKWKRGILSVAFSKNEDIDDLDKLLLNQKRLNRKKVDEKLPQKKESYKPLVFSVLLFLVVLWLIVKFSG